MSDDPIVAEVRAIRDKLAAECNYDVDKIVRRIRQRQAESGREYVSLPPRRVTSGIDAAGSRTPSGGMAMELETITRVPVEQLRLHRGSPRLVGGAAEASDAWIVARLHRSIGLEELLLSFSANGYLDIEPLLVMAGHDGDESGPIVLEDYENPYEDTCPRIGCWPLTRTTSCWTAWFGTVLRPAVAAAARDRKAEIDPDAWASLHSDVSRPFDRPESGRIAVKVINHLGDEVMKVFRV